MISGFLDFCRRLFGGRDEENQEGGRHGISERRSSSGGNSSPLQRETSQRRSPVPPDASFASPSSAKARPFAPPSTPSFAPPPSFRSPSKVSVDRLPPFASEKSSEPPQFDQRNKIGQLPRYEIPEHLQEQIKNDAVPQVLKRPLSPSRGEGGRHGFERRSSSVGNSSPLQRESSQRRSPVPPEASFASPSLAKAQRAASFAPPSTPSFAPHAPSFSSPSKVSVDNSPPFASEKSSELPQFDQQNKIGQLPRYEIPEHLQEQIKNDAVPQVLKRPLSPSTYADHFAALLYAEDYYCEKWSDFLLLDVTLELRERDGFKIQNSAGGNKNNKSNAQNDKPFVAFEIDSVPEKRPFLLSRDHVLLQPAGKKTEPFQGILFRVEKSKWVLAEFADDFHEQHSPSKKYDVSFSFNRVCLKRSHQAVSAAMDPFLCSILFPDPPPRNPVLGPIRSSDSTPNDPKSDVLAIIGRILSLKSPQPYLLEGPLSQGMEKLIRIAILQLYETCSSSRILVCAPRNWTLDALTKSLLKDIPELRIFRANAAFRDYDLVPNDIMPACLFEGECFTCPPLAELKSFRVVTSTFISSYRLYAAGIGADHFTHIFLVDASYATEPETIVAFANLVGKTTAIVATGSAQESPAWVRSDIGRRNGLKKSFFRRLLEMEPYSLRDPMFIAHI